MNVTAKPVDARSIQMIGDFQFLIRKLMSVVSSGSSDIAAKDFAVKKEARPEEEEW
jgi:hypothetical protein